MMCLFHAAPLGAARIETIRYQPTEVTFMSTQKPERLFRERELRESRIIPFGRTSLWRKIKDGSFPQPQKFGPRIVAWRESDIAAWQRGEYQGAHA